MSAPGMRTRIAPALAGVLAVALAASAGAAVRTGSPSSETVRGTAGNDRLAGLGGNDRLIGGRGDDRLDGGDGRDRLSGGRGRDRLAGSTGRDRLAGGPGNDRVWGGPGRDRVNCGSGRDLVFKSHADVVSRDCERVRGVLLTGRVADQIKAAVQAQGVQNVTVVCPPEVVNEKGSRFSCTVTNLDNGKQIEILARQRDRAGHFDLATA
jgi:hypothetical protein